MSKKVNLLQVFVASPSDVSEERTILEQVVRELNKDWSDSLGIMLDLIRWETHAYPGVSTDPQAVVNEQIPQDYDVFIGILWTRFGTPTAAADSGTQHEFERAYERWRQDQDSIRIMFYFKNLPLAPNKIDPHQFVKVRQFQDTLGKKGLLYWPYSDTKDFEALVRGHLARQVQDWRRGKWGQGLERKPHEFDTHIVDTGPVGSLPSADEDEQGFLDYLETGVTGFERLTEIADSMTESTSELGEKLQFHTARFENISGDDRRKLALAKKIANHVAADLELYSARLVAESPLFDQTLSDTLLAYGKAASLLPDFEATEAAILDQITHAIAIVDRLETTYIETWDSLDLMRKSVSELPRMTIQFNRAKRSTLKALDGLLAALERAVNLVPDVVKTMKSAVS